MNDDETLILYTDNISIATNDDGVILGFFQKFGPNEEMRAVARIGISREHAKKFLATLGKQLALKEAQTGSSHKAN